MINNINENNIFIINNVLVCEYAYKDERIECERKCKEELTRAMEIILLIKRHGIFV